MRAPRLTCVSATARYSSSSSWCSLRPRCVAIALSALRSRMAASTARLRRRPRGYTFRADQRTKEQAMTEAEVESLHQRINALRAEHRQLDSLVNRLCATQVYNDQRLQELKLRRLRVKDRLAALERKLKQ
nr:MAG: hypothetical protein DIU74_04335 [Pseudomonadota bacterium]